jgi:glycosidase
MDRRMTFVIFLMISITSLWAQEEELGQRFPDGVEEAEYAYRKATAGTVDKARVEPPNWWVGMSNSFLQVLLYDERIGDCEEITLDYPGVSLDAVHRPDNANYLFLDLTIGPGTPPGTMQFLLTCGEESKEIPYELHVRKQGEDRIQGVDASDLIYLIMPDRFANGDSDNDVIPDMQQTGLDRENVFFRHGGDLIGIMEHLDYLEDIGVTALWLNPVLENDQPYDSYHGYAITDHYNIDARFGNNQQYLQLVNLCHERGIKVIMDIIHNHVGDHHWFIRDLPMEDWIHQPDTFIKTTYRAPTLMDPYASSADRSRMLDGWFDNHMPDLNQQNPFVANYLTQNNIWWMEFSGQDGYRIDTYAYNDQNFMASWGKRMKEEFPTMSFFGETWVHGMGVQSQFTQNNNLREGWNSNLPGVTDFQMYYAIIEALNEEQGWTSGITRIYYTLAQDFLYEDPGKNVLFLDNHDLSRIVTTLDEELQKFKSGIALLLTMRGIPMIYYGTEILISGEGGAFGEAGRRDFPGGWKGDKEDKFKEKGRTEQEQAAFEYVRALANYRKVNPVLQTGRLMQYVPEDNIYVYFRYDASKTVMIAYNSAEAANTFSTKRYAERINGFTKAVDVITGEKIADISQISLAGKAAIVLELKR